MENKTFIKGNISMGLWIYRLFFLQFLFVIYSLRGLIFLGFFPALSATYQLLYRWIVHREGDLDMGKSFHTFYKENFNKANQLGWISFLIAGILILDLYLSSHLIQIPVLHYLLVGLSVIFMLVQFYLYPVLVRYEFDSIKAYFKQSFFIALTSLAQTLAIGLSLFLLYQTYHSFPFLALFFGIPLLLGANAWFAFQGILRAEALKASQIEKNHEESE